MQINNIKSFKHFLLTSSIDVIIFAAPPLNRTKLISEIKPNQSQTINFKIPKGVNKTEFASSYVTMILGMMKFFLGGKEIWAVIVNDLEIKKDKIVGEFI
jgi:hypothetical protein